MAFSLSGLEAQLRAPAWSETGWLAMLADEYVVVCVWRGPQLLYSAAQ